MHYYQISGKARNPNATRICFGSGPGSFKNTSNRNSNIDYKRRTSNISQMGGGANGNTIKKNISITKARTPNKLEVVTNSFDKQGLDANSAFRSKKSTFLEDAHASKTGTSLSLKSGPTNKNKLLSKENSVNGDQDD